MYGAMFVAQSFAQVYKQQAQLVLNHGDAVAVRGLSTMERLFITTSIPPTDDRMLLLPGRNLCFSFGFVEALQQIAGAVNVPMLARFNPRIAKFVTGGTLTGAYGPRLRNWRARQLPVGLDEWGRIQPEWAWTGATEFEADGKYHTDQLRACILKLRKDPSSRQAVAMIWDPSFDNTRVSGDYPCNVMFQFFIRGGMLHVAVVRRSSDLIWGVPYDHLFLFALQCTIANTLNVAPGSTLETAHSLHVYPEMYPAALKCVEQYTQCNTTADVQISGRLGAPGLDLDGVDALWHRWRAREECSVTCKQYADIFCAAEIERDWWWGHALTIASAHDALLDENYEMTCKLLKLLTHKHAGWWEVARQTLAKPISRLSKQDDAQVHLVLEALTAEEGTER